MNDYAAAAAAKGSEAHVFRTKQAGWIGKLVLLVLLAYLVFGLVRVQQRIGEVRTEAASLNEQIVQQTQDNTELANAIENRDDASFLLDIAQEELDLVSPHDRVY